MVVLPSRFVSCALSCSCCVFSSLFVPSSLVFSRLVFSLSSRLLSSRLVFSRLVSSPLLFSPPPPSSPFLLSSSKLQNQSLFPHPPTHPHTPQDPQDGLLDGTEYLNILARRRKTTEQVHVSQTNRTHFAKTTYHSASLFISPLPPPPSPTSLPFIMKASDVETDLLMTSLRLALKVLSLSLFGILG